MDKRKKFLIIGPEGGLDKEETETLVKHGALPYHLGETTLRSETAAIVLAGLMAFYPTVPT